jgi:protein gp37
MSYNSKIEWTEASWNPVIGCTKVSSGCKYCYAEALAERFRGIPGHAFERGFDLRLVPEKLTEPLKWKMPRKIFVCSMSDLFHERIPFEYIRQVFEVMSNARRHTFQVLTKRDSRLKSISSRLPWPKNIWIGVTVESAAYTHRVDNLLSVPAAVKFLSLEPLLSPIKDIQLDGIDWVIVGGESGLSARPMDINWAREIKEKCNEAGIPFFLKQLGGRNGKRGGVDAVLDGRQWHESPNPLAVAALS